ncbi:hypothetical protein Pfo_018231 [Paulownia fortunei]|nr:hypothetical protein Pfo_018231 [Paulownia fortunei]
MVGILRQENDNERAFHIPIGCQAPVYCNIMQVSYSASRCIILVKKKIGKSYSVSMGSGIVAQIHNGLSHLSESFIVGGDPDILKAISTENDTSNNSIKRHGMN